MMLLLSLYRVQWSLFDLCSRLSGHSGHQPLHAGDVVRRCGKAEDPGHLVPTTVAKFSHQSDVFHPAKTLFDLFALYLADLITRCTRRAVVNLTEAAFARHVWRNFQRSSALHKFACVITVVGSDTHSRPSTQLRQTIDSSIPFFSGSGFSHLSANDQPVTVLGHNVTHVTQFTLFPFGLSKQLRIRVSLRFMRFVAARFTVKIIARVIIVSTILRPKRLHRCAGFQQ